MPNTGFDLYGAYSQQNEISYFHKTCISFQKVWNFFIAKYSFKYTYSLYLTIVEIYLDRKQKLSGIMWRSQNI